MKRLVGAALRGRVAAVDVAVRAGVQVGVPAVVVADVAGRCGGCGGS